MPHVLVVRRSLCLRAALLLGLSGCVRSTVDNQEQGLRCMVEAVVDGDTVRCADGTRVRLLAIDAPEMAQAPFGAMAHEQLATLLPVGSSSRLELDAEPIDRYGRTLAYVHTSDGRMANEEMARTGYAVDLVYRPNTRHAERIQAAVEQAREQRKGLWATPAFGCLPRDFRAKRCG